MDKPIIYLRRDFRAELIAQIKQLAPNYEISYVLTPENVNRVEIVLGWDKAQSDLLLDAPHLKWIQATSAGVDYLPLDQLNQKDLLVSNASGIHSVSIAEHVMAVLLTYSRGIDQAVLAQHNNQWLTNQRRFHQLEGQKILVVGTGHIGAKIGAKARGLDLDTYGMNTTGHPVEGFTTCYPIGDLNEIVKHMDIVVNVLPLTSTTHHLYDAAFFDAMQPTASFINVGRGPSVDTAALVQAMQHKKLAFAALDVFEEEPLPKNHPLWQTENVLITPHFSGWTPNFQVKLMAIFLANLETFTKTGALAVNQVNLTKGY